MMKALLATVAGVLVATTATTSVDEREWEQTTSQIHGHVSLSEQHRLRHSGREEGARRLTRRRGEEAKALFAGPAPSDRIIGGSPTYMGQFPFFGRMMLKREGQYYYNCGSVLIAPEWVLTAAHCVLTPRNTTLRDDLWGANIGYYCYLSENCGQEFHRMEAVRYVPHEGYDPQFNFRDDIAVVKLGTPILSLPYVQPDSGDVHSELLAGEPLTAIGAGYIKGATKESPDTLQQITTNYLPSADCEKEWGRPDGFFGPSVFCTVAPIESNDYPGGLCYGDSGGPILKRMSNADPYPYTVTGVVSASWVHCDTKEKPDIHTRVFPYYDWIHDIVCTDSEQLPDWCATARSAVFAGGDSSAAIISDTSKTDKDRLAVRQQARQARREKKFKCQKERRKRYYKRLTPSKRYKRCGWLLRYTATPRTKQCNGAESNVLTICPLICAAATLALKQQDELLETEGGRVSNMTSVDPPAPCEIFLTEDPAQ